MNSVVADNTLMIRALAIACTAVGVECLRSSLTGGIPMPPETHGGAMYAIPGELWSVVTITFGGLMYWATKPQNLWLLAFASFGGALINMLIAHFSAIAEFGFIQSRVSWGVGVIHLIVACLAVVETPWYARVRKGFNRFVRAE